MEELNLKVNDNNEVVVVTTVEQETPISSAELQRQIDQHQAIIDDLEAQLDIVEQFEIDNNIEG